MSLQKAIAIEVIVIGVIVILFFSESIRSWSVANDGLSNYSMTIRSDGRVKSRVCQVVGDRIVDENGSEVIWRGAGGSYLFHAGNDYKRAWETHLPEIQSMGLNTIRLAFAFRDSNINSEYGTPSADILDYDKLDWVLNWLDVHGLKAVLCCMNFLDMYGDFGSLKLINDWVGLASRYRGDPRIVAYELFNEPYNDTWDSSIVLREDVGRAYAKLTTSVRKVDPEHICIWQGPTLCYYPSLESIQQYLQPNVVYTFHAWWTRCKWEFDIWNLEQLSYKTLSYYVEMRNKFKVPVWFGEFGSNFPSNESNPEWSLVAQHLSRCEEQAVGWSLWMGRVDESKEWTCYLPFFPLRNLNLNFQRQRWIPTLPKIEDYLADQHGIDSEDPQNAFLVELWHGNDSITLNPGIRIRVVSDLKYPNGTSTTISDKTIDVTERLTLVNLEGTPEYPGDRNMKIYSTGFTS